MRKIKALALFMALLFILSMLPGTAFASPYVPGGGGAAAPNGAVRYERVYVAMAAASGANSGYTLGTSDSGMDYREYANAYWIDSDTPTVKRAVRTTIDFPLTGADTGMGAYNPPTFIGACVYLLGLNDEGIAIEFEKLPFDPYTSYGDPDVVNNTIRIGNWGINDDGNVYNTYHFDENTKVYFVTGTNAALTLDDSVSIDGLEEDWNDTVRIFYDDDRVLTDVFITAADGLGVKPSSDQSIKWYYSEGVRWNDPLFGYDGFENPYPVQFALYNPIKDVTNLGASDPDALYPLYIYCHGSGGGGSKTGIVSADVTPYITSSRQGEFLTGADGVTGAYIMAARANEFVNSSYGGALAQSWLHGHPKDSNPRYAAGDESYRAKATQCAALISNILWLIENENVDPDRIYLAGNSAGGYMAWSTLFEAQRLGYGDLFAAIVPNVAAFGPEGDAADLANRPNLNELGLQSRLESVKDVPVWMFNGETDAMCGPTVTFAVPYTVPGLNGTSAWYETVASLSDGVSPIQGSPLTRVTTVNGMGHDSAPIRNNNVYPSGANAGRYYSEEISASAGANALHSGGYYEETLVSWLNTCGAVKAGMPAAEINGDKNVVAGPEATAAYTVSISGTTPFNVVQVEFEVDGEVLSQNKFKGIDGFSLIGDVTWKNNGEDSLWAGTAVLSSLSGAVSGDREVFEMVFDVLTEQGSTAVKLISVTVWNYVNEQTIEYNCIITKGTATTVFEKYYSKYDVNKDGKVDGGDISKATYYFMVADGEALWNTARICDVNGDGIVDIEDLILIRINFSQ